MKEATLLEQFILNSKATNEEHRQALAWLQALTQAAQKSIEGQDKQS